MFQEYIALYQQHSQKYGKKTAIFLQVGSFYELYDAQNKDTGETKCNVTEIVDLLGIQMSSKKGDYSDNEDGLFAGFPDMSLHKWAGRLTNLGWTVVVVDQSKDHRGKVKDRSVSRILSPSTHIEAISSVDTPYVYSVCFTQTTQNPPMFGAALLDLTTGSTKTYSGQAQGRADVWTVDDLVQMTSVYSPKEINIHWKSTIQAMPDETVFRRMLSLSASVVIYVRQVDTVGSFASDLVRVEYLQKVYSIKSILPPRTYLGLRDDNEELSLLYLLQFIEEHYATMLRSFQRNEPWVPNMRLICGNHALTQLQMINALHPEECVVGLFNKAITPMGKRAVKERILSPYSDAHDIRKRLDELTDYMSWPDLKTSQLERQLRFMFDLPRLHRKVLCGIITPSELGQLYQTYRAMTYIMEEITTDTPLASFITQDKWTAYLSILRNHVSEEKVMRATADLSALHSETYPDIGRKEQEIDVILSEFQTIRADIARRGGVSQDALRLEEREKEPYGLKGSSITLQQLKKNSAYLLEGTRITELKSGGWVECNALQQCNTRLQKARDALDHLNRTYWSDMCMIIMEAGTYIWSFIEQWIAHVDTVQCMGRVSKERGFHPPTIEDAEQGSAVEIQAIRHPLVETTASRVSYVKHNISLGYKDSSKGWLIYGTNASGKSTTMKAVGIAIILAQAGCFVPAQSMRLRPFRAIYTRILNQDNLFAGLSSFAVEMSELRDILRGANPYTMVLGDELCSGTESISAQALVASGIQWLSQRNSKFIFATHLHDLPKYIDVIKEGVEIWHLHVEYDPVTQRLVYHRTLRPGSGSTMYGLEVAKAMDLPAEFIEQALKNRHKILGTTIQEEAISSAWNSKIVRKECESCHRPLPTSTLEVHHIQPRASATHNHLPDGTHMNDQRNLMVICQECHDKIHAGTIIVGDLQMTSNGPERVIQAVIPGESHVKKSKWTEEEQQIIMDTLRKYTSLSLKALRSLLESRHEIQISEAILGKMRREITV